VGPGFERPVPPGGYAWWYVDALSRDGRHGLTVIAFIGSVFSPYYRAAGWASPEDHVSLNVALYGPGRGRWAMTERGRGALARSGDRLAIGGSALAWGGDGLTLDIDEVTALTRERVRGRLRLLPEAVAADAFALDPAGQHQWRPIATRARIEARFTRPSLSWDGWAYLDSNWGAEPLEAGFRSWHWSRAHLRRDTAVLYEGVRADGSPFALALRVGPDGTAQDMELPVAWRLPPTPFWRMPRHTRIDPGHAAWVQRSWEDTPFYSRSAIATRLWGERAPAVHESLSMTRFATRAVQFMLPYRMPRRP
jgi:carotenoid 1,2-hydratase